METRSVTVRAGEVSLPGDLRMPDAATGLVIFAHGSGSSRFSKRNRFVAERLHDAGLATLLFDLLTEAEDQVDQRTREHRFDIPMLGERMTRTIDWAKEQEPLAGLATGLFGSSTGAAAALIAAANRPDAVDAVVSRGGRPDLAEDHLPNLTCPTLLIVGGKDTAVIGMNREAADQMAVEPELKIVEGASHLFEEPGKLEEVADLAATWFRQKLS
jgi:dienelactone hydrolase